MSWLKNEHGLPDRWNGGYVPNPEATDAYARSLPHGGSLAAAAPDWIGDGQGRDLMPYLAFKEVEFRDPDGGVWKPLGVYPPYRAQTGNNCTAEGRAHTLDLLQAIEAAAPVNGTAPPAVPFVRRVCVEFAYASGLSVAGLRGDNGCYGSAMAKAASKIGDVSYAETGPPYDEDAGRLQVYANSPDAAVVPLKAKASEHKTRETVLLKTVDEVVAWVANRGGVTIASRCGFATPRDSRGFCQRRGVWAHQMCLWGILVSDGHPSAVVSQSWGPETPEGPRPFDLPGNCFRITFEDLAEVLAAGDTWGYRGFPGFEKAPLPARWTYVSGGL